MYVIGLTGGIGSGKSTVAKLLEDEGAAVLSADLMGHEVYLPGKPAYDEIIETFGPGVVAPDGTIDRKKLGPIVFADPANLAKLNAITHPPMKEMMRERLAEIAAGGAGYAVLEAALLFDAGWDDLANEVWVTVAPARVAAERTAARSGIPAEQVLERIQKAQMESDERVRRSDIVIDTSGTMEETAERARQAWTAMRKRVEGRR
ncbi:MAG TPA: dephospho-CoA kinase [Gemmatimonadales bacterium]|nr:dephospho-CoA kinase [Gemmatimonadales bacterium]